MEDGVSKIAMVDGEVAHSFTIKPDKDGVVVFDRERLVCECGKPWAEVFPMPQPIENVLIDYTGIDWKRE